MFIITQDYIQKGAEVGTCGPRRISDDDVVLLRQIALGFRPTDVEVVPFQLFDDDGEHYYDGIWVNSDGSDEFQPLDCFGGPNAGCTMIKTRNLETGKYEIV